jgi:hypothetical protein
MLLFIPLNILLAVLMDKLLYILPFNNWNYTEVIVSQVVGWSMILFATLALASFVSYITYKTALYRNKRI